MFLGGRAACASCREPLDGGRTVPKKKVAKKAAAPKKPAKKKAAKRKGCKC